MLTEIINEHGAVVFNGDGYSEEWHAEAEKRGLPNLKTTIDALPVLQQPDVIELFDKYKRAHRRASCRAATRSTSSSTSRPSTSRPSS